MSETLWIEISREAADRCSIALAEAVRALEFSIDDMRSSGYEYGAEATNIICNELRSLKEKIDEG